MSSNRTTVSRDQIYSAASDALVFARHILNEAQDLDPAVRSITLWLIADGARDVITGHQLDKEDQDDVWLFDRDPECIADVLEQHNPKARMKDAVIRREEDWDHWNRAIWHVRQRAFSEALESLKQQPRGPLGL